MKAETALITINNHVSLKVLLIPENDKEVQFLEEALEKAENYHVSAQIPSRP